MLASTTVLPVIGVPVALKTLDGLDSLLSIVQMPAGVPVATVSIGGARNAGLLAARILAAGTDEDAAALDLVAAELDEDDPRLHFVLVYDFLTWLQESLTQALVGGAPE